VYNKNKRRAQTIKLLENNGWWHKRECGSHDIYTNGTDCKPISRHREIKEAVAKTIIKRRGLK